MVGRPRATSQKGNTKCIWTHDCCPHPAVSDFWGGETSTLLASLVVGPQ